MLHRKYYLLIHSALLSAFFLGIIVILKTRKFYLKSYLAIKFEHKTGRYTYFCFIYPVWVAYASFTWFISDIGIPSCVDCRPVTSRVSYVLHIEAFSDVYGTRTLINGNKIFSQGWFCPQTYFLSRKFLILMLFRPPFYGNEFCSIVGFEPVTFYFGLSVSYIC